MSTTGVWQVFDEGRCDSVAMCQTLRDRLNTGTDDADTTPRIYCWQSPSTPDTAGQHLVRAVKIYCATPTAPSRVGEWTVSDAGRCNSPVACTTRRDMLNNGRPDGAGERRAYCWQSPSAPETSGQHLVIASKRATTTTTTTTTTTAPPTTRPPRGGGEFPEIDLVS